MKYIACRHELKQPEFKICVLRYTFGPRLFLIIIVYARWCGCCNFFILLLSILFILYVIPCCIIDVNGLAIEISENYVTE